MPHRPRSARPTTRPLNNHARTKRARSDGEPFVVGGPKGGEKTDVVVLDDAGEDAGGLGVGWVLDGVDDPLQGVEQFGDDGEGGAEGVGYGQGLVAEHAGDGSVGSRPFADPAATVLGREDGVLGRQVDDELRANRHSIAFGRVAPQCEEEGVIRQLLDGVQRGSDLEVASGVCSEQRGY